MQRLFLLILSLVGLAALPAHATNIWLSTSDSDAKLGQVPAVYSDRGATDQKLYVWARPDAGKTLRSWNLNLRSDTEGVVRFTNVDVHNLAQPVDLPLGHWGMAVNRYEQVSDFESNQFLRERSSSDEVRGFGGHSLGLGADVDLPSGLYAYGVGLGDASRELDTLYDARQDAWLLATVTYDVTGVGKTDLFLQIGEKGILNAGERTADQFVVFGRSDDPPLRGGEYRSGREWVNERVTDSATADATIVVSTAAASAAGSVPEPSSFVLAMLGVLSLLGSVRKGRAHGNR